MNQKPNQPTSSNPDQTPLSLNRIEDDLEEMEDSLERMASSRRSFSLILPIFIFLATLLGSLIGAAADLNESKDVIVDIMNRVNPPPRLSIAGSNTVLGAEIGLAAAWQQGFEAQEAWIVGEYLFGPEGFPLLGRVERTVDVQIDPAGSSKACQNAAAGDPVDLLVTSEPIPCYDDLIARGIEVACMGVIGYDVIAFVTHINNNGDEIEKREMKSILQGTITNWAQVRRDPTPIRILARQGSGTTDIVLNRLTDNYGVGDFPAHFQPCGASCETDEACEEAEGSSNEQCLNEALNREGSLYWVSTAWLRTQPPRYLRLILIKPEGLGQAAEDPLKEIRGEGETEAFDPDKYTPELIRPLYMYVLKGNQSNPSSTDLARKFLGYVRGIEGQYILEEHHFYTHFDRPANVEPDYLPGFEIDQDGSRLICRPTG